MGAVSGALTFTRFFVRGELPEDLRGRFVKNLRLRVLEPLRVEEEETERVGWCCMGRTHDLELRHDEVFQGGYLCVGLRLDRWKVPSNLVKVHLAEATEQALAAGGKEKLSKREKDELKRRITLRLKKKTLPSMRSYDVVWNLDTGVLLFWSQSARLHLELSALFEATFGLDLVAESPFVAAMECGLSEAQLDALSGLEEQPIWARPLVIEYDLTGDEGEDDF